jgi:hypothetical protein
MRGIIRHSRILNAFADTGRYHTSYTFMGHSALLSSSFSGLLNFIFHFPFFFTRHSFSLLSFLFLFPFSYTTSASFIGRLLGGTSYYNLRFSYNLIAHLLPVPITQNGRFRKQHDGRVLRGF